MYYETPNNTNVEENYFLRFFESRVVSKYLYELMRYR